MSVLVIIMLGIMLVFKILAVRSGSQTIEHFVDCTLTKIFYKKILEKKSIKHGFLDLYKKELALITSNQTLITLFALHNISTVNLASV